MDDKALKKNRILNEKIRDLEMKLVEYEDEKLLDFINSEFRNNPKLSYRDYTNNLNILKQIDQDILMTAKARMKIFTENFHALKYASAVIASLITILTFAVSEFSFIAAVVIFIIAILAGMVYGYIVNFSDIKHHHLTAVYFTELLEYLI